MLKVHSFLHICIYFVYNVYNQRLRFTSRTSISGTMKKLQLHQTGKSFILQPHLLYTRRHQSLTKHLSYGKLVLELFHHPLPVSTVPYRW